MSRFAPVAVTGLGCLCAAGGSLDACMAGLFRGVREPRPPARFSSSHPVQYPVFEVPDFAPVPGLLRTSALGLAAAREALAGAGLDPLPPGLRVGVCVGTTVAATLNDEGFCRAHRAGAGCLCCRAATYFENCYFEKCYLKLHVYIIQIKKL